MKTALCLAALLVYSGMSFASPLTGNIVLTGGGAYASEYSDTSGFSVYGPNFSASDTTLGGLDSAEAYLLSTGSIGFGVGTAGADSSCTPAQGEYMGVQSACFGPFGLPATTPGYQPSWDAGGYIGFTPYGTPTFDARGDLTWNATVSGELIGFSPAYCAQQLPITCEEQWDVTLTGHGTITLYTQAGSPDHYDFVSAGIDPPAPAPEPPTAVLFAVGAIASWALIKRRHVTMSSEPDHEQRTIAAC